MIDGKTPRLELKLERLIDTAWRGVRQFVKHLTYKPKTRFQLMDKHALIAEIMSFVLMGVAIIWRLRG